MNIRMRCTIKSCTCSDLYQDYRVQDETMSWENTSTGLSLPKWEGRLSFQVAL